MGQTVARPRTAAHTADARMGVGAADGTAMRTATGVRAGVATMALLALTACGPATTAAPAPTPTTTPAPTPTVSTANLLGDAGATATTRPPDGTGSAKCTVDVVVPK